MFEPIRVGEMEHRNHLAMPRFAEVSGSMFDSTDLMASLLTLIHQRQYWRRRLKNNRLAGQLLPPFEEESLLAQSFMNFFAATGFTSSRAVEWSKRSEESAKRAAFEVMARMAVRDMKTGIGTSLESPPVIVRESVDDRNVVRKAVNWAVRQIERETSF